MELNDVMSAVASVGFPIVMCFLMGYYIISTIKENTKALNDLCGKLDILFDRIERKENDEK